jgi:hypothetical protein
MIPLTIAKTAPPANNLFQQLLNATFARQENIKIPAPL